MAALQRAVVVGGSLAGLRAAESVRRHGFAGRLVIVGEERHYPPVDRPPLSKEVLAAGVDAPARVLKVAHDLDAEILAGRCAVGLDAGRQQVTLDDGQILEYDGLVIATGASARRLPVLAGWAGVHVLRTVDDALALRADLHHARRVAVIGAGVLGCEIAATARGRGLPVALIDVFDGPMQRAVGPQMAGYLADLHRDNGVELYFGRSVAGLVGDGRPAGVALDGGEVLPADVVVACIGVTPRTEWLAGSGLSIADGVACDEFCFAQRADNRADRTIAAAGDVARWAHPVLGNHIRVEHWTNAVAQGQLAGRNLASALTGGGPPVPYAELPYFWSDQYDRKLQLVGVTGDEAVFAEGGPGDRQVVVHYRTGGRLVGGLCVNRPARLRQIAKQVLAEAAEAVHSGVGTER